MDFLGRRRLELVRKRFAIVNTPIFGTKTICYNNIAQARVALESGSIANPLLAHTNSDYESEVEKWKKQRKIGWRLLQMKN